jgi:hypothetical protein
MPWAQFDDHFHDSEAALIAGPEACGLHLWATCWSAAHLTDGRLPEHTGKRLVGSCEHGEEMVERLKKADLWASDDQGWRLLDFFPSNRSRAQVEADRVKKAESGRKGGRVKAERDREARSSQQPTAALNADERF